MNGMMNGRMVYDEARSAMQDQRSRSQRKLSVSGVFTGVKRGDIRNPTRLVTWRGEAITSACRNEGCACKFRAEMLCCCVLASILPSAASALICSSCTSRYIQLCRMAISPNHRCHHHCAYCTLIGLSFRPLTVIVRTVSSSMTLDQVRSLLHANVYMAGF
jgi:hypothetical protein